MLFSLACLIDFHHFFQFLLAFLRYGEEIWPKEPWLLLSALATAPVTPFSAWCWPFPFPLQRIYFQASVLLLSCLLSQWELLVPLTCEPSFSHSCWTPGRCVPAGTLLLPCLCCGTHSASAIYCSSCQAAVGFISRIKKIKWSHALFCRPESPYRCRVVD